MNHAKRASSETEGIEAAMSEDRPFLELLAKIDGGSMCCLKCHEVYAQFQPTPTLEEALEMHYYAEHE